MKLSSYLPRNHVDAMAMGFTFIMIPVSYLHGVLYIAPTIWPTADPGLPEETLQGNILPYFTAILVMTFLFANTYANLILTLITDTTCSNVANPVVSQPGWYYCHVCRLHAPPRTHHCPFCQKCVLRRDHHCYFVGRCVGYYNHRYFLAFLVYLTISAVVGVVTSLVAIFRLAGGFSITYIPAFVLPVLAWLFGILPANFFVMFQTSIAFFVTLVGGGMLCLQLYLVYNGQTYYEMQKSIKIYGRDLAGNVQDVMGRNWWFAWILPFIPSPRIGDGAHYPPWDDARTNYSGAPSQQSMDDRDVEGDQVKNGRGNRKRKIVTSSR